LVVPAVPVRPVQALVPAVLEHVPDSAVREQVPVQAHVLVLVVAQVALPAADAPVRAVVVADPVVVLPAHSVRAAASPRPASRSGRNAQSSNFAKLRHSVA
jgi:hypothetical protein